jgi:hypothetical protein
MIINDLNFFCPLFIPNKADAPLIIDTNAVLAGTVTFERLKAISRRYFQIIQPDGNLELPQLPSGHRFNIPEAPHVEPIGKSFSISTFE